MGTRKKYNKKHRQKYVKTKKKYVKTRKKYNKKQRQKYIKTRKKYNKYRLKNNKCKIQKGGWDQKDISENDVKNFHVKYFDATNVLFMLNNAAKKAAENLADNFSSKQHSSHHRKPFHHYIDDYPFGPPTSTPWPTLEQRLDTIDEYEYERPLQSNRKKKK